ncbi:hypothetical protein ACICHK_07235 [Streptomyces sp. AHU1]|uniref:hypothetical protein n=1 Tax=Streptomyces sp. AHU1 TaxID=3377215 RepID=UPI0038780681
MTHPEHPSQFEFHLEPSREVALNSSLKTRFQVPGIPTGAAAVVDGTEAVTLEVGVDADVDVGDGAEDVTLDVGVDADTDVGVGDAGCVAVPEGVEAVGVGVAVEPVPVPAPVVKDFTGEALYQRSWNLYAT